MYLINHFLDTIAFGSPVPDVSAANVTNAVSGVGSLGTQVDTCVSAYSKAPNYLLVDVGFFSFVGRIDHADDGVSSMNMAMDLCSRSPRQSMG